MNRPSAPSVLSPLPLCLSTALVLLLLSARNSRHPPVRLATFCPCSCVAGNSQPQCSAQSAPLPPPPFRLHTCRLLQHRQGAVPLRPTAPMSKHARPSMPSETKPPSLTLTLPSMLWTTVPKSQLRNVYAKVFFALELPSVQAQSTNSKLSSFSLNNQIWASVSDLES